MTDNAIPTPQPDFPAFFRSLLGSSPYRYQTALATDPWPELLDVPTGLGKTAAIGAAWLWKRSQKDPATPTRLVYCLPMRTLVEQTARVMREWCERASVVFRESPPAVHMLMGGVNDEWALDPSNSWFRHPERDAILVGTQDMLLSRALMRGYAMSPYAWPIHFAFLHSDALWVFDEVQLMGPAIATSAQLEGLRRKFPATRKPARSMWCSATLSKSWLATFDLDEHLSTFQTLELGSGDREQARRRLDARKDLSRASTCLSSANVKGGFAAYARDLATEILSAHRTGSRSLVILNQVERAQAVYRELKRRTPAADLLLLHSRFRPPDRARLEQRLRSGIDDQIVVATQVVEAGVDISSATLFTELCPWDSFVQRCGRCNRAGEYDQASVFWIDLQEGEDSQRLPYASDDLSAARSVLIDLHSADAETLRQARARLSNHERPLGKVLRRRDLLDLFSTDADLSGFHVDVSEYIRDTQERMAYVFWRDFDAESSPLNEEQPGRDELCAASLSQLRQALKNRSAWRWDPLAPSPVEGGTDEGRWLPARDSDLFPGLTVMLRAEAGGYDAETGFDPRATAAVSPLKTVEESSSDAMSSDRGVAATGMWIELDRHLAQSSGRAQDLCSALGLDPAETDAICKAALWHDVGKLHRVFQEDLLLRLDGQDEKRNAIWAKSPWGGRQVGGASVARRRYFRHELVSALLVLENLNSSDRDLIAYLVAAHHGKVRTTIRAFPDEPGPQDESLRYARGVWEGDEIPSFEGAGVAVAATRLSLDVLDLGGGETGPSWTARVRLLLDEHGPFRLAWLESLVRMADWRASADADATLEGGLVK